MKVIISGMNSPAKGFVHSERFRSALGFFKPKGFRFSAALLFLLMLPVFLLARGISSQADLGDGIAEFENEKREWDEERKARLQWIEQKENRLEEIKNSLLAKTDEFESEKKQFEAQKQALDKPREGDTRNGHFEANRQSPLLRQEILRRNNIIIKLKQSEIQLKKKEMEREGKENAALKKKWDEIANKEMELKEKALGLENEKKDLENQKNRLSEKERFLKTPLAQGEMTAKEQALARWETDLAKKAEKMEEEWAKKNQELLSKAGKIEQERFHLAKLRTELQAEEHKKP